VVNKELEEIEKKIERVKKMKEEAVRAQEFEKAAELRDEQKRLTELLKRKRNDWEKSGNFPVVTLEDIAQVTSMWTGIPLSRIEESESQRLFKDGRGVKETDCWSGRGD